LACSRDMRKCESCKINIKTSIIALTVSPGNQQQFYVHAFVIESAKSQTQQKYIFSEVSEP
jgi:hypothetical protein